MCEVAKSEGAEVHLHPINLSPQANAITVLLGATLAGKTSLMRLMAGLDVPTSGRVLVDDVDVTGIPVRKRNVAMVYQQFINYPSLTVYDNIASPLKLRRASDIDAVVRRLAKRLHIDAFLQRFPAELSGGQQQRVALARALAKHASLILLDEPLVNLDFKLREELRDELAQLFSAGQSTVIYATTDPGEALLLGGYTAVLKEGRLLQYGPTVDVFRRPASLDVALAFSDPPLNVVSAQALGDGWKLDQGPVVNLPGLRTMHSQVTLGLRAASLRVEKQQGDVTISGQVQLAEISGADSFVHLQCALGEWVMQKPGVHTFALGESLMFCFDPSDAFVFDSEGGLLSAPLLLHERSAFLGIKN
ncbi:MAG: ABC transporter ATP-binding protein [Betaproteobacteria bacterium]|nr:ABC transporter ATP-binding protein [Betaproteobacteria bacterium]